MCKHTPGAWRIAAEDAPDDLWIEDADGRIIASLDPRNGNLRADAVLIATAPELLEALQEVKSRWESGQLARGYGMDSVLAAITKATGNLPVTSAESQAYIDGADTPKFEIEYGYGSFDDEVYGAEFDTQAEREAFLSGGEMAPYFRWRQKDPGEEWTEWIDPR
jgi:hypothetical protein